MNKSQSDLESELGNLVPRSPSPGVAKGVAAELVTTGQAKPADRHWRWGGAGLAVAASLIVAMLSWPRLVDVPVSQQPAEELVDPRPPTMLEYGRALGQSKAHLDDLLDRHAGRLLTTDSSASELESLPKLMTINEEPI